MILKLFNLYSKFAVLECGNTNARVVLQCLTSVVYLLKYTYNENFINKASYIHNIIPPIGA